MGPAPIVRNGVRLMKPSNIGGPLWIEQQVLTVRPAHESRLMSGQGSTAQVVTGCASWMCP